MKKVLIIASTASMIEQFNMPNIYLLQNMGFKVDVACNFENGSTCDSKTIEMLKKNLENINVSYYQIDFARNITKVNEHIKAYNQILNLMKNNNYDFIHCHSPIGGVIGRLCGHRTHTPVTYTAHGFHFFKGGPIKNWVFYPVEKFCSRYTDVLVTINNEDYQLAKTRLNAKKVFYIPSVGIDTNAIYEVTVDRDKKRDELGIPQNNIVLLSVGELNDRKNHETIIKAMAKIKRDDITYAICGQGGKHDDLLKLADKLGLGGKVKLYGYRNDIKEICKCSDIFCFPSKREGFGLAAAEAMAAGLPIITSNINGFLDYVIDGETGFKCEPTDSDAFAEKINMLIENEELRLAIGQNNINAAKRFDINNVMAITRGIYENSIPKEKVYEKVKTTHKVYENVSIMPR